MANIHPSSFVSSSAVIEDGVEIGPFCSVGDSVTLRKGVRLVSHVSVDGIIEIGEGTIVYPFASLGHPPQDLKYSGETSRTVIGRECVIREHVTIQPGTKGDRMETVIGNNCLLMVGSHVAHDCVVGNRVIMANNATLSGHVTLEDHVILGGLSAVHQFVRIGAYAMIGGMSGVEKDVLPYGLVKGERAYLSGLNVVGLKRNNFSYQDIQRLQASFDLIFDREGTLAERVEKLKTLQAAEPDENCKALIDFISASKKSLCSPKAESI